MTSRVLLYDAHGEPLIEDPADDEIVIPPHFSPDDPQPGVSCTQCGCTDEDGCEPDGCFWVAPELCSSCCPALAEAWQVAPELVDVVVAQLNAERESRLVLP